MTTLAPAARSFDASAAIVGASALPTPQTALAGAPAKGSGLLFSEELAELGDQLFEHGLKPAPAALDGGARAVLERLDHEVDRAVLEVPAALVEARADRARPPGRGGEVGGRGR